MVLIGHMVTFVCFSPVFFLVNSQDEFHLGFITVSVSCSDRSIKL